MNNDFLQTELETMNENYHKKPPRRLTKPVFEEKNYEKLEFYDELNVIYREEKVLIKEANVFWGYIVQANTNLFRWFPPFDYPACIIYSPDPVLGSDINKMQSIAQDLFSYKGHPNDAPTELNELALWISDEITRFFNIQLPDSLTGGKEVYITTINVIRKNLPGKKLNRTVFPILAAPEYCQSSTVLPKKYWSENYIKVFSENDN